eukprot:CAMPEP_0180412168 /NCGR_PEP_ID=MMETSP0989-20121125/44395_1 /TAXON_ID=697907 /ORGANISM="non described non described, Strain CCMP2293" /LENGTH=32 /DNA_ID= /DNA_START= /DNA_END= /DNA_ORIENTATION=
MPAKKKAAAATSRDASPKKEDGKDSSKSPERT